MTQLEKYHKNTLNAPPHKEVSNLVRNLKFKGTALDLGCGSGRDTIELLKNGWKVISIDFANTKDLIESKLTYKEIQNFKFIEGKFENVNLEKNDLTIAYFSLQYCESSKFQYLWQNIENNLNKNGFFMGNFLGNNDSWKNLDKPLIFFSKESVLKLFENFEIIKFDEIEKDGKTGLGIEKHWHIFNVIAKKK